MSSSSSPPSSAPSSSDGTAKRTSPHGALAFLVHSPNTVANDLPPDVDNGPLARQKRRRTSKEDEELLKAEYLKNPKPDKATRMAIVAKVALGEKEVQIWFQNKRQNDRRRSRPLEPSSSATLLSDASNMSDPLTEGDITTHETEESSSEPREDLVKKARLIDDELKAFVEMVTKQEASQQTKTESQSTIESTIDSTDPRSTETAPTEPSSSQQALPSSQGASQARSSWISNRRSASFRHTEDYAPEAISFPNLSPATTEASAEPTSTRSLGRAHSFVRLSMTDEGTARVITDADKTPSPPHAKPNAANFSRAAAGLRRSYSAAGFNERISAVSQEEPTHKVLRMSSNMGRSRDSRAWEFWCDPDTRHSRSLTTRADQEGSGSAADAIGLLRANRKVLGQDHVRQNTPVLAQQRSAQGQGEKGNKKSRGPMQRASTSYGRLQTKDGKKGNGSESDEISQTESDKENWEPDSPQAGRPRQLGAPITSQRPRQILGENTDIMSQSSSLGAMMTKEKNKSARKNSGPEQDEELRTFMNSGELSANTNLSSAEEAGCVEGLLKLSQGNWR